MSDKRTSIRLALVDDHKLFRKGLRNLIEVVGNNYEILFEADNGLDMKRKMATSVQPDIILMDINMPGMNGFLSVEWLKKNFPQVKVLVVSMVESEESIVKMLKLDVKEYLSKDVEPKELGEALTAIMNKGFYYTDFITGKLVHSLQNDHETPKSVTGELQDLSDKERKFIELACSELTYNEIAERMFLSPRTIDGYRDTVFEKLSVKSRIGLILYAVKSDLVRL